MNSVLETILRTGQVTSPEGEVLSVTGASISTDNTFANYGLREPAIG